MCNYGRPKAKDILESIIQVIVNLVCTFDLKNNYLDKDDNLSRILAATDFTLLCKYRTKLKTMVIQLVFGHDMILNTPFIEIGKLL